MRCRNQAAKYEALSTYYYIQLREHGASDYANYSWLHININRCPCRLIFFQFLIHQANMYSQLHRCIFSYHILVFLLFPITSNGCIGDWLAHEFDADQSIRQRTVLLLEDKQFAFYALPNTVTKDRADILSSSLDQLFESYHNALGFIPKQQYKVYLYIRSIKQIKIGVGVGVGLR